MKQTIIIIKIVIVLHLKQEIPNTISIHCLSNNFSNLSDGNDLFFFDFLNLFLTAELVAN